MQGGKRAYPRLSACGLNCGLCPRFHTDGASRCPGCGGEDFFAKRPSCGVLSCNKRNGGIEYCCICREYPCGKFDGAQDSDSFITHRNMRENFERIRKSGLSAYQAELDEKVAILEELLEQYNDGRKKSFFCLAVNLLELQDVRELMAQLKQEEKPGNTVKENAAVAVRLFEDMAKKRNMELKLRKKKH